MFAPRLIGVYALVFIGSLCLFFNQSARVLTRLTNNDPYPLYSSSDPYEFLSRCYRNALEEYCEQCYNGRWRVAKSVFRQSATKGTNIEGVEDSELGDLRGPWNFIGLFYDPDKKDILEAKLELQGSSTLTIGSCDTNFGINLLTNPAGADPNQRFGFVSVPIVYRKYGARIEAEVALNCEFSLTVQAGVSHVFQEPNFIDLSCTGSGQSCPVRDCIPGGTPPNVFEPCLSTTCCELVTEVEPTQNTGDCLNANCCIDVPSCACKTLVIDRLIKRKDLVEEALGLKLDQSLFTSAPFSKTGFEDIEVDINWVRLYPINKGRCDWPFFVLTPFASLGVTFPTAKPIKHNNLFALPFGNDGHFSYGGRAGFTFDFVDAFAIGGEIGFTGFTPRTHNHFPAPTHELQSGVFPELVTMRVQPGFNWMFAAYLGSYRFLDRFSAYVQYAVVNHEKNDYEVVAREDVRVKDHKKKDHHHHHKDTGFLFVEPITTTVDTTKTKKNHQDIHILTKKLRDESHFRFHMVNAALNYEISPHIQLGIVWQIPIFQRNAYRSTTVLGTFQVFC